MDFKTDKKVYFNPYCTRWSQFLVNFVVESIFFHRFLLPDRCRVLVVYCGVDPSGDFEKDAKESQWDYNAEFVDFVSRDEYENESPKGILYDMIFFLDAKEKCEYLLSARSLLKKDGILICLFHPDISWRKPVYELRNTLVSPFADIVLSKYHIVDFKRKEDPELGRYGQVLAAYGKSSASEVWNHMPIGPHEDNLERFISDWITLCKEEYGVDPEIRPGITLDVGGERLSVSFRQGRYLDLNGIQEQVDKLRRRYDLEKRQLSLEIKGDLFTVRAFSLEKRQCVICSHEIPEKEDQHLIEDGFSMICTGDSNQWICPTHMFTELRDYSQKMGWRIFESKEAN